MTSTQTPDTIRQVDRLANHHSDEVKVVLPARKRWKKYAILSVAIMATLLFLSKAAQSWWGTGRFIESTDDAYIGGDIIVIAPKVSGFIATLAVTDNQPVKAGDLLLRLDDRDYSAALAKANAAVALQRAALTNLHAMRRLQQAVVSQAQAGVAASDAETTRARDDQARLAGLLKNSAVSVQESQRADADFKKAVAAGDNARAILLAAQRQMDVFDTQEQQIQATLKQALAEEELAQLNVNYTELRAPADGVVGNRVARVGAYSATGAQLLSLVPTRGLWIDANFKESQLARIRPGQPASVEIDAIPGKTFHGRVSSVAPATCAQFSVLPPENATGNFTKIVQRVTVRILLDDSPDAPLQPGLSVTAKIHVGPTAHKNS